MNELTLKLTTITGSGKRTKRSPCRPLHVLPALLVLLHLPPLSIHAKTAVCQEVRTALPRRTRGSPDRYEVNVFGKGGWEGSYLFLQFFFRVDQRPKDHGRALITGVRLQCGVCFGVPLHMSRSLKQQEADLSFFINFMVIQADPGLVWLVKEIKVSTGVLINTELAY